MGIGKRIKEARLQKNLKQEDLAAMIGVQPSSIGNYENEVSHPKEPVLYALFEALEVSPNFLFQDVIKDKKILLSSEGSEVFELYNKLTPQGKQKVQTYMHDILGNPIYKLEKDNIYKFPIQCYDRAVSAGTGNPLDYESSSIVYISKKPPENASFMLLVDGDSMKPTYNKGDYVFVDKGTEPAIGDIGIFIYNGEAYIKERGEKGLVSHNPVYELIKGSEDIRLVGRVVGKYTGEIYKG